MTIVKRYRIIFFSSTVFYYIATLFVFIRKNIEFAESIIINLTKFGTILFFFLIDL